MNRSFNSYEDTSLLIDFDIEYGRKEMSDKLHIYRLFVRKSRKVNLEVIDMWLQKKMPFDENVLQALSEFELALSYQIDESLTKADFLDHLMREWPSSRYKAFKRSFFDPNEPPGEIDYTINVFKGWYQAIRPVMVSFIGAIFIA
jgi:eukaryotic translation initiation factor 2C